MEVSVLLSVIRAVVPVAQPCWFRIGYFGELAGGKRFDDLFLALNFTDLQPGVLGFEQDLVSMETEKNLSSIFSSYEWRQLHAKVVHMHMRRTDAVCIQDIGSSGMKICKLGQVINLGVDNYPLQNVS